jgi:hypothetical protein
MPCTLEVTWHMLQTVCEHAKTSVALAKLKFVFTVDTNDEGDNKNNQ